MFFCIIVFDNSSYFYSISRKSLLNFFNFCCFRVIMPGGNALVFLWAFSPSPIEIGHLKACISTAAFAATVASTQRESHCEARGGFTVGFLEKSVSDWWSKYVILVT